MEKLILDATAGLRMMWFDKDHPNVIYLDERTDEELDAAHLRKLKAAGYPGRKRRHFKTPTVMGDFRKLDFPDERFKLIVWDPPFRCYHGKSGIFSEQYGRLQKETWPDDIRRGASELWRVLQGFGVLIFKWNDNEISFRSVLRLFPVEPLFGQITGGAKARRGKRCHTAWFCFMKLPKPGQKTLEILVAAPIRERMGVGISRGVI